MSKKILVIDDDQDICLLLKKFLSKNGFEVDTRQNGEEGISHLKQHKTDLVICDFKLPDYDGLEILQKIKIVSPETVVIIITGYSDVRVAVDSLKKGAFDYVTKPLFPDEILMTIKKGLDHEPSPKAEGTRTKQKKQSIIQFIQGVSEPSRIVDKHIDLVAPTNMDVVILGETGTGKEYVARSIHSKSQRKDGPFVAVDCGALPGELAGSELFGHVKGAFTGAVVDKKGSFEVASGGTLFLDEIGNLSYENQIKLLRVLQERSIKRVGGLNPISVDVRLLVATNDNLKEMVKSGDFREDLYYRLNEFKIELTPIRERPDDIEVFANHFLSMANQELQKDVQIIPESTMIHLKSHYWHGNLRELKNVVKRAVLLCNEDQLTTEFLPEEILLSQKGMTKNQIADQKYRKLFHESLDAIFLSDEQLVIEEVVIDPESLKEIIDQLKKDTPGIQMDWEQLGVALLNLMVNAIEAMKDDVGVLEIQTSIEGDAVVLTVRDNGKDAKNIAFKQLGYTKLETAEIVESMNKLIANYSVHYQKLRNFHWNVKGGDFFDIHEKFEEQYNFVKIAIDDLAERIRVFGQTPYSTMHEYLQHSEIKETGTDLTSMEMVREIIKDYEILLEHMFKVIEVALETGDSGTEDMVKGFVKQTEKNHWMMTSFSQQ
ncbi:zraR [Symbiodinium microadriaticum]|nr:zraR [Symbiodinium microadriaticum]